MIFLLKLKDILNFYIFNIIKYKLFNNIKMSNIEKINKVTNCYKLLKEYKITHAKYFLIFKSN